MKVHDIFVRTLKAIVQDDEIPPAIRRWGALIFLVVAIYLGWRSYEIDGLLRNKLVNFRPDLKSGIAAVLLVSAVYVRKIVAYRGSVYCLLTFALNVTIVAILIQAVLGNAAPFLQKLQMPYILSFAIVLTWAGIREVALVAWIAVIFLCISNLLYASKAMETSGFFFVLLSVIGIFLQTDLKLDRDRFRAEFKGNPVPAVAGKPARATNTSSAAQSDA